MIIALVAFALLGMSLGTIVGWQLQLHKSIDYKQRWETATKLLEDKQLDALDPPPSPPPSAIETPSIVNGWTIERHIVSANYGGKNSFKGVQLVLKKNKETIPVQHPSDGFCVDPGKSTFKSSMTAYYKHASEVAKAL